MIRLFADQATVLRGGSPDKTKVVHETVASNGDAGMTTLVSESESEWLYYIVDTLRKGQANLLMRSCTEAM